jgi:hypothetical protein
VRHQRRNAAVLAGLALACAAAVVSLESSSAGAANIAQAFHANGRCLTGQWTVPYGVTQVQVQAMGAVGGDGDGYDTYTLNGDFASHQDGGKAGWASRVVTTIPVTPGEILYVGVANSFGQPNAMPGGPGEHAGAGIASGDGGAASWIASAPPSPSANGNCVVAKQYLLVVAAGGGGGGGAATRRSARGGDGGTEAYGGDGGNGTYGGTNFSNTGAGGGYSNVTLNSSSDIVGTAGAGGNGGHSYRCTSGTPGAAGALYGDPVGANSPPTSRGGPAGIWDGGSKDCSVPPKSSEAELQAFGGSGGGGGGGLYSGGGGGGGDDSSDGGGGGGASGTSFSRDPAFSVGSQVSRWTGDPEIDLQAVTTPPSITSVDHATFVVGQTGSFTATATGVDTPYVDFFSSDFSATGFYSTGLTSTSATYPNGSGAGSATLSGSARRAGVYNPTVRACNSVGCAYQSFTLTIDQAPSFGGGSNFLFAQGQQNSVTIGTGGFPAPSISATGGTALPWLTVTDNGDGTATLSGTPPAGSSPNTYTVDLQAANGIGADAHETVTFTLVDSLSMSPTSVHLIPGIGFDVLSANPAFFPYEVGWQQQLTATGTRPDGSTFDATGLARWSSSNSGAVVVDQSGFASAQALGTATVTAATYGSLDTAATIVSAVPLSITVTPATVDNIIGGATQQFTATGCYADPCSSNSYDISSHVVWSVLPNDGTMTIGSNGVGHAQNLGTTSVVATQETSATPWQVNGYALVHVTNGDVTSIDLDPAGTSTATTNGLVTYGATVHYQSGAQSRSAIVNWSARDVSGRDVVFVGQNIGSTSQIVTRHTGTAAITASYTNPDGTTASASATLNVITVPRTLTISGCDGLLSTQLTPLVLKGETCQLTATATLNDGTDVDVTKGVTWTSSDPSAFTVSSTGLVTATGSQEGAPSNIRASYAYTDANGVAETLSSNSILPAVTLLPPVSLSIAPTSVSTLHPNGQQQFTATATYADGSTLDVTSAISNLSGIQWTVDSSVADSVSRGLLHIQTGSNVAQCKTQSPCTVHVQAWIPTDGIHPTVYSNPVAVTVTDPLDHITFSPDSSYRSNLVAGGSTGGLHAEGWDAFGNDFGDVTQDTTFTIHRSDGSVDPDGSCSGFPVVCTATDADTGNGSTYHTITATDPNATTPQASSTMALLVTHATADHVVVTGGSSTAFAGQSTPAFVVTAYDTYGNSWDVTGETTFLVSPEDRVDVNGTTYFGGCDTTPTCRGYVTGEHTITAAYHFLRSDEQDVTLPFYVDQSLDVSQIVLSGGTTELTQAKVAVGAATPAFIATLTDVYGNTGPGTDVDLTISPDGTCDDLTETCVPAAPGTHTVQADVLDGNGDPGVVSNTLTFEALDPDHLAVTPASGSIHAGGTTAPYTVVAYDSSDNYLGDVTAASTLAISPDGSCDQTAHTCTASVGDEGGGSHTVTATYDGATGSATLTVLGLDHIQLVGDTSPLRAGESTNPFRVEGYADDGTDLGDVTADVTLSISPDGTCDQSARTCSATVADTGGSLHTITATYDGGSNPSSSLQLEVDASPVVASAELLGGSASIAAGNSTAAYQVLGLDQYGNVVQDLTAYATLSISPGDPGAGCDQAAHTCTATVADANGSYHTVAAGLGNAVSASTDVTVTAGPVASLRLAGGSQSAEVGRATSAYSVEGADAYGNDVGDVTGDATLSISPDGTCDQAAHTCTGGLPDSTTPQSYHTIAATDGAATGTALLVVTPNDAPLPLNQPFLDDQTFQYNTDGAFTLDYGPTQDINHDALTYTLEHESTAAGSQWNVVAAGLTCDGGHSCSYTFGGSNPPEEQGTWIYRMVVTDGYSLVYSPASNPVSVDDTAPTTTDDVSSSWSNDPNGWEVVTLNADDGVGSGVYATYFQILPAGTPTPDLPADPMQPAIDDPSGEWFFYWDPGDMPHVRDDQVVVYYSVDNAGNTSPVETSAVAHVDNEPPYTYDDVAPFPVDGQSVPVTLTAQDQGSSGVAFTYYEIGTPGDTVTPTTSSPVYDPDNPPTLRNGEQIEYFSVDNAGNAEPVETSPVAKLLLTQSISLTATPTTQPWWKPVALSASGYSGTGRISYHLDQGSASGCSISGSTLTSTGPGACEVYVIIAPDSTYDFAYSEVEVTFTSTITVDVSGTQTYGSSADLTYTDDAPSGVTLSGTLACTTAGGAAFPSLAVGNHTVDGSSCSGLAPSDASYTVAYSGAAGGLVVGPATIAVSVTGAETYGASAVLGYTDDAPAGVSLINILSCTTAGGQALSGLPVGSHTIDGSSCSGLSPSNANYVVSYTGAPSGFVVTPATIMVRPTGFETYGSSPVLGYTDDAPAGVSLINVLSCTTAGGQALSSLHVGSYTIDGSSCSGLSPSDANYVVSYAGAPNGLVVGQATVTVTVSGTGTYGSAPALTHTDAPAVQLTGTLACATAGGQALATLPAGSYTVDASSCSGLTPADSTDYAVSYAGASHGLVVTPATVTVTVSGTEVAGSSPVFSHADSPAVPLAGTLTCGTAGGEALAGLVPGSYTLDAVSCSGLSPSDAADYVVSYAAASGGFAVSAAPVAPRVSAVSPASGVPSGGAHVAVSGSGFGEATAVLFGSSPAASFTVVSDAEIDAVAPAGSGQVDVTVVNAVGTSPTSPADRFTYAQATIAVTVSGTESIGSSASFTYTSDAPAGVTLAGTLSCTTAGGSAISGLAAGRYTVDGASCSGLTPSNAADYAVSYAGAANGLVVSLVAPGTPVQSVPTAGNTSVTVYWTAGSGGAASAYKVFDATSAGRENTAGSPACTAAGGAASCQVTGLVNGTTYYFVVVASNAAGTSSASNEQSAAPAAAPVLNTLAFTTQPSSSAARGAVLATQPVVTIEDSSGHAVDSTAPVTLSVVNTWLASLACQATTVSAVHGVATFSGCALSGPLGGYRLLATSSGSTQATSTATTLSDPVSFSSATRATFMVGVAGSFTVTASSGTVAASGSLPAWLSGSASGSSLTLSGTPTAAGRSVLAFTDSGVEQDVLVTVLPSNAPGDVMATAGTGSASVGWTAPAGASVTSYSVVPNDLTTGSQGTAVSVTSGTSTTVSGLTAGDKYDFLVSTVLSDSTTSDAVASNAVVPVAAPPSSTQTGSASLTTDGTSQATIGTPGASGSIVATAVGEGSVSVGTYSASPLGAAFSVPSGAVSYDVAVAPGSQFSQVSFQVCDDPDATVYWFDPVTRTTVQVSPSAITSAGGDCVAVTLTSSTTPSVDDLYGTVFLVQPSSSSSSGSSSSGSSSSGTTSTSTSTGSSSSTPSSAPAAVVPAVATTATAPLAAGAAASVSVGSGTDAVSVTVPAGAVGASAVLTVTQASLGGVEFAAGTKPVQVAVTDGGGAAITRFGAPLDLAFPDAPPDIVPAYSIDGTSWTEIPGIAIGSTLPAGWPDGWYRDADGTLHILTAHATYFGLLTQTNAVAKALRLFHGLRPTLNLNRTHVLVLHLRSTLPVTVVVTLRRGGRTLRTWRVAATSVAEVARLTLPAGARRIGKETVTLTGAAGGDTATARLPVTLKATWKKQTG